MFGTPMGLPLSPIIAELALQDLEEKASLLNVLNYSPIYYYYVDDIIMTAPKNRIDNILKTFNSFHSRMQFTVD